MKNHRFNTIAATGMVLLAGCATPYPETNPRLGQAVMAAKEAQVVNRRPARDPATVSGLDGMAAKETMDRYVGSFKSPPPTINVFNIGGAVGSQ